RLGCLAGGAPGARVTRRAPRVGGGLPPRRARLARPAPGKRAPGPGAPRPPIGRGPPNGAPRPLPTVIDPTLENYPTVWMGGGAPNSIFGLTYRQLLEITGGRICAVNGAITRG